MIDQKRENLLNLALAATEVERRRVSELSAGYNSYSKTWEIIVQYQGDLDFLEGQGVRVTLLLFSYAILLVPESLMDYVTELPQITYLEKPKSLCFSRMRLPGACPVLHRYRRGLSGSVWGRGAARVHRLGRRLCASGFLCIRRDKPDCTFMGSDDSGKSTDGVCTRIGVYTAADQ